MSKIITNEMFLSEIQNFINPKLELLDQYKDSKTKIACRCKNCGYEWSMLPGNIKKGRGCPKCSCKTSQRMVDYKNKTKDKLFNFVKNNCPFSIIGEYVNSTTKIECECFICKHKWLTLPSNIYKGQGCPECGKKSKSKKLTTPIEEIYKNLPENLSILQYERAGKNALFKCNKCGYEWYAIPSQKIINKTGCPNCSKLVKTDEQFKTQLLKINSDIEVLEQYINATTKLLCYCKKCGCKWKADPHHLLHGKGCPSCNKSKGEMLIQNILNDLNINYEYQFYLKSNFDSKIFVDFKIQKDEQVYFIEYNGIQHYVPIEHFGGQIQFEKQQKRDQFLKNYCKTNNIKLIEIKYDLSKNDIIEIIKKELAVQATQI